MTSPLKASATALVTLLLSVTAANAQISIGAKAGAIFSNLTISFEDLSERQDGIADFVVGIPVEIRLSDYLALQPELNLMRQGTQFEESFQGFSYSAKTRFTSLEVPVLVKAGLLAPDRFSVAAVLGPSLHVFTAGKTTGEDDGEPFEEKFDFEDDGVRRLGLFAVAGLQLGLPTAFGKLTFDARYRQQVSNLADLDDDEDDVKARLRGFSLGLGLLVGLGE